jgi:phenol 2-monooxygenase (NADPH)
VGRADGLQPKTIETLRMLGLADTLLQQSVKIYDITMWQSLASPSSPSSGDHELRRLAREVHYPAFIVDLVDPFLLIGHQGMVEKVFVDDLAKRGIAVRRCHKLDSVSVRPDGTMEVQSAFNVTRDLRAFDTTYLVGCDGAHSQVRKLIVGPSDPGARDDPDEMSVWGVLDGEVDTNFPDIWTKCVVFSEQYGSVLIIPRERDMTRLYIEMRPDTDTSGPDSNPARMQANIMRRAAQIIGSDGRGRYRIRWKRVEWFGQYRVSQRVAPRFSCPVPTEPDSAARQRTPTPSTVNQAAAAAAIPAEDEHRIFIAGDAAHTHSPKAAQGMNTALHDSWNLAWKLNLAIRGLAKPSVLLESYSEERQKIARDLVAFDFRHAQEMSRGNPTALADNFKKNVRFISGVGCEYAYNALNLEPQGFDDDDDDDDAKSAMQDIGGGIPGLPRPGARPGCTLPPGKVSRYIDANPVDVQLDIPVLGQFRLYFFIPDVLSAPAAAFLVSLCGAIAEPDSLMSRLSAAAGKSYLERPRVPSKEDIFKRPERYNAVSQLFAFALISK